MRGVLPFSRPAVVVFAPLTVFYLPDKHHKGNRVKNYYEKVGRVRYESLPVPRRTVARQVTVPVIGMLAQGMPVAACDDHVTLPGDRIEKHEIVYRITGDLPEVGLAAHDLLIIEPRATAATGEFVIATLHGHAFVGRWWTKRGARSLLDNEFRTIVQGPELAVLGAVTLIARYESG